ncbi:MAG: hypothetical protein WCH34_03070 [Bacteroidota bacterium]
MQLLNQIKQKILLREIRKYKADKPRHVKVFDFHSAKNIGVIYELKDEIAHNTVSAFVKQLQDNQKNIRAVGYIPGDLVPHYCIPKLSYDFYTRKNQTFIGKPNLPFVNDFLKEEFDLLIDLSMNEIPSLNYLCNLANASFKVGKQQHDIECLDVMIQINEHTTLDEFIELIKHYINLLKTH